MRSRDRRGGIAGHQRTDLNGNEQAICAPIAAVKEVAKVADTTLRRDAQQQRCGLVAVGVAERVAVPIPAAKDTICSPDARAADDRWLLGWARSPPAGGALRMWSSHAFASLSRIGVVP
jgi:hypothetical protein